MVIAARNLLTIGLSLVLLSAPACGAASRSGGSPGVCGRDAATSGSPGTGADARATDPPAAVG